MTTPKVYKTEAIVLKRMNLGEADRILTLYGPNLGKFRAVAKGVRRPKSKMGGHLELLTHSALMLARGKNLDIITQCQTIDSFLPLRGDLWRTTTALYAAELVDQFTAEHVENRPLYKLLLNTLLWLCEAQDVELTLRYFELKLLTHLGYKPQLHQCVGCNTPIEPTTNFFSSSDGGVLCPQCQGKEPLARPISVNALKVMRFLEKNEYPAASKLKLDAELSRELEQLMRHYIRYLLEREVRSVEFLDRLRRELR
ncbi:MAG: DNA repair protein RecO [Chloroflexi bacterium]|nr:DNA repair protein RecO [Chloroflexota bacterium]